MLKLGDNFEESVFNFNFFVDDLQILVVKFFLRLSKSFCIHACRYRVVYAFTEKVFDVHKEKNQRFVLKLQKLNWPGVTKIEIKTSTRNNEYAIQSYTNFIVINLRCIELH